MRSISHSDYLRYALIALVVLIMAAATPASAKLNRISATLVAEQSRPAAGDTLQLAIRMTPAPGWHGYWQNPGDSGMPPRVEWKLPDGITASPLQHPVPSAKTMAGFKSYVYDGSFALLTSIKLPASAPPGTTIPITGELSWLACSSDVCVPESTTIRTSVEINSGRETSARNPAFQSYRSALPTPYPYSGSFFSDDDNVTVTIKTPPGIASSAVRFFPITGQLSPTNVTQSGDTTTFHLRKRGRSVGKVEAVIDTGPGTKAYQIKALPAREAPVAAEAPSPAPVATSAPLPSPAAPEGDPEATESLDQLPSPEYANDVPDPNPFAMASLLPAKASETGWLAAFLGAILGGLLLNLMPCVFPILSLKALSLARSGTSRQAARIEAVAYTGGAVISTTALGAVLVGLQCLGAEIGWAFQLQNPYIVLALVALMTAIGANLLGLFEIRSFPLLNRITGGSAPSSAFGTGALAAFVATPCSGPFMGVALGAALFLPPLAALSVFTGLGLGIALPFLAIGFLPALRRFLPKPGDWMVTLRRVLAVPMLLTAAALIWVLSRQVGHQGLAMGLGISLAVGIGLAWLGITQKTAKSGFHPILSTAMVGALAFSLLPAPIAIASADVSESGPVQTFSEKRLDELRRAGTPVFVDFTADWCLTCKVNEKLAINDPSTQRVFERAGVVTLVGDWTNGDPAITEFLAKHGRNSIPYYLVYMPGERPQELPQILTAELLADAVQPIG
ncbi:protein-disulfide reductase DsbD domain-containing protein [Erythrobacter aureus]|uniref:Thiol:disulfide interchange protein n=1 Tax=Erythrobacter aureus TaxID=2182384 RepID=A0A345YJ56_9SPHN|nr:protein-disulfide reductase DsbD domain-containing protein [Erythrobacter aureus]AXK43958.1 thiol:disulfide interchange protein [Erythrobacter aureus]